VQLEQVPIPTPRPAAVVVQVKACNVVPNLKNVLATYAGWLPNLPLPKVPAIFGLDSVGVVTQVGDQVRGVQVGDRVYVNPGLSCGSCRACRRGEDLNCPDYIFMGYFAFGPDGQKLFDAYPYGGLAEYLTAPERNLVVLPDSVTFEQGARVRLPRHRLLRAAQDRRLPGPHRPHRRSCRFLGRHPATFRELRWSPIGP
jgi:threonine dehydrogenase-like Zn-dependent dehydrogenase